MYTEAYVYIYIYIHHKLYDLLRGDRERQLPLQVGGLPGETTKGGILLEIIIACIYIYIYTRLLYKCVFTCVVSLLLSLQ